MAAQVVSFHCTLKNNLGQVLGRTFNQDVILAKNASDPGLQGLVEGLMGLRAGEKRTVNLRADQAYGFYDPALVVECPRSRLKTSGPIEVGETVVVRAEGKERLCRVIALTQDIAILDGNHPLAGQDLTFEIEATSARDALPEDFGDEPEIAQFSPRSTTFH